MRFIALGKVDECEWDKAVARSFAEWYSEKWKQWHPGETLDDQSLLFRSSLGYRAARMWWQGLSATLRPLDELLRAQGVIIVIELTERTGPHSERRVEGKWGSNGEVLQNGEWIIRIPLPIFTLLYATAAVACEVEHEGWRAEWALTGARQGIEFDPLERPFSWLIMSMDAAPAGDIKYGQQAASIALDAVTIIALHEIAHCLLAHHDDAKVQPANPVEAAEMRWMEVEADMLAGAFFAALDMRTQEERRLKVPITWNAEQATRFARAVALLTIVMRWADFQGAGSEAMRTHHRAFTRAYHTGLGALTRFHAVGSADLATIENALQEAPALLAMYACNTPLEKYLEPETEDEERD